MVRIGQDHQAGGRQGGCQCLAHQEAERELPLLHLVQGGHQQGGVRPGGEVPEGLRGGRHAATGECLS